MHTLFFLCKARGSVILSFAQIKLGNFFATYHKITGYLGKHKVLQNFTQTKEWIFTSRAAAWSSKG